MGRVIAVIVVIIRTLGHNKEQSSLDNNCKALGKFHQLDRGYEENCRDRQGNQSSQRCM